MAGHRYRGRGFVFDPLQYRHATGDVAVGRRLIVATKTYDTEPALALLRGFTLVVLFRAHQLRGEEKGSRYEGYLFLSVVLSVGFSGNPVYLAPLTVATLTSFRRALRMQQELKKKKVLE
jgi:hypothetical protein